jgi:hypothetical protein
MCYVISVVIAVGVWFEVIFTYHMIIACEMICGAKPLSMLGLDGVVAFVMESMDFVDTIFPV